MSKENRKSTLVLIAAHLAVVLPLAYLLNIWVDEGSTLYTTEHGFFFAFQNTLADEKQAPLYFWLLSLWREINHSIFFARLFSIICSLAAIKFFADLARQFFDGKVAILITAFFALHPYLIWASLEIRVYSLVILLSAWLLKFFREGYFETDAKTRKRSQIYFTALAVIALYTNYYLGFTLVGMFFALLILRKWREAKIYFLQMLLVGAVFAPLIWLIKSQFSANVSGFQEPRSLIEGLRIPWNFALTFLLPTEILPPEDSTTVSVFRLWLARAAIVAGIVLLIKKRRKPSAAFSCFGTIAAVNGVFLIVAYFLLGAALVQIRHAAVLFVPLILTAGLFTAELFAPPNTAESSKKSKSPLALIIAALIMATFFVYSTATLYPNLTKHGDWARVGAFIELHEQPNQPIIVFQAFDALTLPYHYHGLNVILPDEKFFDWEIEAEPGGANSQRRQTEFIISEIPPDAPEIWLLTNDFCRAGQTCEPLENFVQAHYTVIEEKDFYKEKVRLLRKK